MKEEVEVKVEDVRLEERKEEVVKRKRIGKVDKKG